MIEKFIKELVRVEKELETSQNKCSDLAKRVKNLELQNMKLHSGREKLQATNAKSSSMLSEKRDKNWGDVQKQSE